MSSPRVQKIFEGIPDQLKRLGGYTFDIKAVLRWQGRDAAGRDACVLDIDSATWADNARRAILVAVPSDSNPSVAAMHTQSHASGHTLDGSVRFLMYLETPESWTGAQAHFGRLMQQVLLGQLAAPLEVLYTANDTEPTVDGVNGETSTASATSAGQLLPYGGISYPGGV
jgi:hypothetical protein